MTTSGFNPLIQQAMKFRLSYKIFAAFTLTLFLVVALLVGLVRFYVGRNFADYVNLSLLERYSEVAEALAAEYRIHQGWQALDNNPEQWRKILRARLPAKKINPASDDFEGNPRLFQTRL